MRPEATSILWRRLDRPGHEAARLVDERSGWTLAGSAVFLHEGNPCCLDYSIACDRRWATRAADVTGWLGGREIAIHIEVDAAEVWRLNGEVSPAVSGCVDIDLNFSPSTNLIPIRRLNLPVGEEATVRAAWLRFPSFTLEPLEQVYRRTGERSFRYESAGGTFVALLETDEAGFVTEYPRFASAEGRRSPG